jgi:hypothetical protein
VLLAAHEKELPMLVELQSPEILADEHAIMREALAKVAKRQLSGETGHDEAVKTCPQALAICDQMGG